MATYRVPVQNNSGLSASQAVMTDGDKLLVTADYLNQSVKSTASPTFGGVVVADGGTVGQAAGPLLTFDDNNDYLSLTGAQFSIGTLTPEVNRALTVVQNTADAVIIKSADSGDCSTLGWGINTDPGYAFIQSYKSGSGTTQPFRLYVGSGERLSVDESGLTTLSGNLKVTQHAYFDAVQTATGDLTTTIDWGLGNKFYFTFGAASPEVFTFTAPDGPCNLVLVMKQDGVGSRLATWPNTVMWPDGTAPTLSTGAAAVDIVCFFYDGTNYFGNTSLDFSVPV